MVYRKPWDRLPPSRRCELDRDTKAFHMRYSEMYNCWSPSGMRSKKRFQRVLKSSEALLQKFRSDTLTWILTQDPPLKSIPHAVFPEFLRLVKHKGFSVYHKGKNLTPKVRVRSERNQWRLERDLVDLDKEV